MTAPISLFYVFLFNPSVYKSWSSFAPSSPRITFHIPERINKLFSEFSCIFYTHFNSSIFSFFFGRKCIAGKEQKSEAEVETFLLTLRVSILSGIRLSFSHKYRQWRASSLAHSAYEQFFPAGINIVLNNVVQTNIWWQRIYIHCFDFC